MRYQALGSSGDPNAMTPSLDGLAAEGVRCTQAVSQYPVCMPFRAALMTGLPANLNGVERHGDFLDPATRTVAHAFADAGYRTSYVGKWHLAPESGAAMVSPAGWAGQDFWVHPRLRGGFQDWFGFNISNNYYETYICSGEKVEPLRLPGYQTDALTDISIDYLSRMATDGAGPWFHVISYESPHPGAGGPDGAAGYPVPDEYRGLYDPARVLLRPNVPPESAGTARGQLAGYYRLIANLDDNVGRLLAHLDGSGLGEETLVVFLSDHGEMGGSHGLRNKQVPYEESLHVPLIFRHPGLTAGSEYGDPICGLDIAPTCLGLCGLPGLDGAKGIDHSGALRPSPAAAPGRPLREAVLVQWNDTRYRFGDHPYRALRSPRYTFVLARDDAFCLLFDRETDPYELRNLYWDAEQAELRARLSAELLALLAEADEVPPGYVVERARR